MKRTYSFGDMVLSIGTESLVAPGPNAEAMKQLQETVDAKIRDTFFFRPLPTPAQQSRCTCRGVILHRFDCPSNPVT